MGEAIALQVADAIAIRLGWKGRSPARMSRNLERDRNSTLEEAIAIYDLEFSSDFVSSPQRKTA
jgi:hypothetical protein